MIIINKEQVLQKANKLKNLIRLPNQMNIFHFFFCNIKWRKRFSLRDLKKKFNINVPIKNKDLNSCPYYEYKFRTVFICHEYKFEHKR